MMSATPSAKTQLIKKSLKLNQDGSCLSVGTTTGFIIYNLAPFRETFRRNYIDEKVHNDAFSNSNDQIHIENDEEQGVYIVSMLYRCNLLALVTTQQPNKVIIYDDHQQKSIGELVFRTKVMNVELSRSKIAVATVNKVYLYNFGDLSLLDSHSTHSNLRGVLCLHESSTSSIGYNNSNIVHGGVGTNDTVLVCPSAVKGCIRVELYDQRKNYSISAHEGEINTLAISLDGTRLASASVRGTVIRIFDVRKEGVLLHELHRGVERACVSSMSFRNDRAFIAVASDRGTVHIFKLDDSESNRGVGSYTIADLERNHNNNTERGESSSGSAITRSLLSPKKMLLSPISKVIQHTPKFVRNNTYLRSEPSFAQVRNLTDPQLCTFLHEQNMIAIIGSDGSFRVANYENGGEADLVIYHKFFKEQEEELKVDLIKTEKQLEDFVSLDENGCEEEGDSNEKMNGEGNNNDSNNM